MCFEQGLDTVLISMRSTSTKRSFWFDCSIAKSHGVQYTQVQHYLGILFWRLPYVTCILFSTAELSVCVRVRVSAPAFSKDKDKIQRGKGVLKKVSLFEKLNYMYTLFRVRNEQGLAPKSNWIALKKWMTGCLLNAPVKIKVLTLKKEKRELNLF